MSEFRRDALTGHWVLLSPERLRRPSPASRAVKLPKRPFKARLVRREVIAGTRDAVEVHTHLYPAIKPFRSATPVRTNERSQPGRGDSYIVRFSSGRDVVDSDRRHRVAFAETVTNAVAHVRGERGVSSIALFRNHGVAAGASLAQPHHQLWGMPVPSSADEAERAWVRTLPGCPTCALIRARKDFVVAVRPTAVLLARPGARFGAELLAVPMQHAQSVTWLDPRTRADLVELVALGVRRLRAAYGDTGINEVWQERIVASRRLHFRIELLPRLNMIAGLELGSGVYLNPYQPEVVAKKLRSLSRIRVVA